MMRASSTVSRSSDSLHSSSFTNSSVDVSRRSSATSSSSCFSSGSFSSSNSSIGSTLSHEASAPVLFCNECKRYVTNACLAEGKHRHHTFVKLQDVVEKQIEELESNLKHLKTRTNKPGNVKQELSRAKKQFDNTYQSAKDVMTSQYRELQALVDENQQQAFLLLQAEKESQAEGLYQLAEEADTYEQRYFSIMEKIQDLERRQEYDSLVLLLDETEAQLISLETMNQLYSNVEKRMTVDGMRMNALENSVTKILLQNEKLLPQPWEFPEAITFDLDNKHKDLIISEDKCQVSLRSIPKKLLKDSKRTTAKSANILASQCFSTGQHYWEVDVAGSLNWSVGVVEKDWLKNGMGRLLGRDKRSWVLESDEGNLTVLHHNDISTVREASVQRLGVFVDCDKGRVKFFDALTGKQIHVFLARFKSEVVPAFCIRDMGHSKNSSLVICKIIPSGVADYVGSDFDSDEMPTVTQDPDSVSFEGPVSAHRDSDEISTDTQDPDSVSFEGPVLAHRDSDEISTDTQDPDSVSFEGPVLAHRDSDEMPTDTQDPDSVSLDSVVI